MIKYIVFIIFLFLPNQIHSQNNCRFDSLYQIKKILFDDLTKYQNKNYFLFFYEKVEMKIDTLISNSYLDKYFIFIRIKNIDIISMGLPDNSKYQTCFKSKIHNLCDNEYYLLALDKYNAIGGYYDYLRLKGFDRLDIDFFFKILQYNQEHKLKKKDLSLYKNQLFDIHCFYESWKKYSDDSIKYPCLKPCMEELSRPFIVD